jgi:hypothetical protein
MAFAPDYDLIRIWQKSAQHYIICLFMQINAGEGGGSGDEESGDL